MPADAVFLSCQAGDGPDVIVAMGQIRVFRPDIVARRGGDIAVCGWTAVVPLANVTAVHQAHAGPLRLHAWSLDVHTGRAARLAGEAVLKMPG